MGKGSSNLYAVDLDTGKATKIDRVDRIGGRGTDVKGLAPLLLRSRTANRLSMEQVGATAL